VPPDEVAEAQRLHDGAEQVDSLFVGESVVESGHEINHLASR
jgi:hypothetical protein